MYDNLNLLVKLADGITPFFRSEIKVRQGRNLSPMLFNLFINDLIEHLQGGMTVTVKINGYSCNCLMYAEDFLLLSESWEGLCHSIDKLGRYSAKWRSSISSKKTKIMVFGKSSKGAEVTHNIGKVMVKSCQEYPYLGTIMTPSNSFAKCKVHLSKQADKVMLGLLKEVNTQNGGKASAMIKLFNSACSVIQLRNSLHNFTKFNSVWQNTSSLIPVPNLLTIGAITTKL